MQYAPSKVEYAHLRACRGWHYQPVAGRVGIQHGGNGARQCYYRAKRGVAVYIYLRQAVVENSSWGSRVERSLLARQRGGDLAGHTGYCCK